MRKFDSAAVRHATRSIGSSAIPRIVLGAVPCVVFLPDVAGMAGSMAKGAISTPGGAAETATRALGGLFGKKKKN